MGSYYCPDRKYNDFQYEVNVADLDSERATRVPTIVVDPRRDVTSTTHRMTSLLLVLTMCAAWAAASPTVAAAAGLKTCRTVRVDLGVIMAAVSQRNTSCQFARHFVRRHRVELCSLSKSTIEGWRKSITGTGEDLTCALRKGSRAIRTNACGA